MIAYVITVQTRVAMPPGSIARTNVDGPAITITVSAEVQSHDLLFVLEHELRHAAHHIAFAEGGPT